MIRNIPQMSQINPSSMSDLAWKFHENPFMCVCFFCNVVDKQTNKDEDTTFAVRRR